MTDYEIAADRVEKLLARLRQTYVSVSGADSYSCGIRHGLHCAQLIMLEELDVDIRGTLAGPP